MLKVIRLLGVATIIFLTPHNAFADCPRGLREQSEYRSSETYLKWSDEKSWGKCLNLKYPERNNARDSYGMSYGDAEYQCGDIRLSSVFLGNTRRLPVEHNKYGRVDFVMDGGEIELQEVNPVDRKKSCADNGSTITCYETDTYIHTHFSEYTNKKLLRANVKKTITTCTKISF